MVAHHKTEPEWNFGADKDREIFKTRSTADEGDEVGGKSEIFN